MAKHNERRSFARYNYNAPIKLTTESFHITDNDSNAELISAKIGNYSRSGTHLSVSSPLDAGIGIHFMVLNSATGFDNHCKKYHAEVIWCKKNLDEDSIYYKIGVRYMNESPAFGFSDS